jgi:hypothetical protein
MTNMSTIEEITNWLRGVDSFAAIDFLSRQPDALAAAKSFADAAAHFYWKEKDLPASIMLGRAGAQYALAAAERLATSDPALASELRGKAKAMTYNLASFTWPGWDEPGITITAADLAVGLDAAKANLRLGRELSRGPLPLSRAHWMLAAHWIAAAEYERAREQFRLAARDAATAGAEADRLLCQGFEALTGRLALTDAPDPAADAALRSRLDDVLTRLGPLENGEMFVRQIETAGRVFPLSPAGRTEK